MIRMIVVLLALLAAPPAAAQIAVPEMTPEQTRTANEAMALLRSPVTPFHTVDMCPSMPALRDTIRVAAAEGMTTDQIVEGVIARYGEQVRLLPRRRGAGLLAWIATPLVMLVGAGLVIARLRRGQDNAPPVADGDPLTDAERERVSAALSEWEESGEVDP
jgi:cytochrome c-type biogenesis protein CcmH